MALLCTELKSKFIFWVRKTLTFFELVSKSFIEAGRDRGSRKTKIIEINFII